MEKSLESSAINTLLSYLSPLSVTLEHFVFIGQLLGDCLDEQRRVGSSYDAHKTSRLQRKTW